LKKFLVLPVLVVLAPWSAWLVVAGVRVHPTAVAQTSRTFINPFVSGQQSPLDWEINNLDRRLSELEGSKPDTRIAVLDTRLTNIDAEIANIGKDTAANQLFNRSIALTVLAQLLISGVNFLFGRRHRP
jgi:hypothetical protein